MSGKKHPSPSRLNKTNANQKSDENNWRGKEKFGAEVISSVILVPIGEAHPKYRTISRGYQLHLRHRALSLAIAELIGWKLRTDEIDSYYGFPAWQDAGSAALAPKRPYLWNEMVPKHELLPWCEPRRANWNGYHKCTKCPLDMPWPGTSSVFEPQVNTCYSTPHLEGYQCKIMNERKENNV